MRFIRDRRPPLEQAKSGLRIAGAMIATVVTVALFGLAYVQIANADHTHNSSAGWLLMITLVAALGLTVQYWRRWFFFIPGYLGMRSCLGLLLGWFSPRGFVFIGFPILMLAMCGMSFRFGESAKLRGLDRVVLLATAACLLAAMLEFLSQKPNAMALIFAAMADLALFASRFYSTRKSRQRAAPESAPLTLNR